MASANRPVGPPTGSMAGPTIPHRIDRRGGPSLTGRDHPPSATTTGPVRPPAGPPVNPPRLAPPTSAVPVAPPAPAGPSFDPAADAAAEHPARYLVAGALLALALLLPWNIRFGLLLPWNIDFGSAPTVIAFVLLIVATALSVTSLVLNATGRLAALEPTVRLKRQLALNAPYLALVGIFVLVGIGSWLRNIGNGAVPLGVGAGIWAGAAGVLLAIAPTGTTDADERYRARFCRIAGQVSIGLGSLAALITLYLRTHRVVPHIFGEAAGANLTTAFAAVLYTAVALAPVVLVGRWMISGNPESRLPIVLIGSSALTAATLVWLLPVGRDLDTYRGIGQSTNTVGVGYEGYLAWTAVAAVIGVVAVRSLRTEKLPGVWRAARPCLLLIAVWCGGMAALRVVDLILAAVLGDPAHPYNGTALMAFDAITAVLAVWLFLNSSVRIAPPVAMRLALGALAALTWCRLVVGVGLAEKAQALNPPTVNDGIFGNSIVHQITGTFDVTLAVLASALLAMVLVVARRRQPARPAPGVIPRIAPAGSKGPRSSSGGLGRRA